MTKLRTERAAKQTTKAERDLCEALLHRIMTELGSTYFCVLIGGDEVEISYSDDSDGEETAVGLTLEEAYISARFAIEGLGNTPPTF